MGGIEPAELLGTGAIACPLARFPAAAQSGESRQFPIRSDKRIFGRPSPLKPFRPQHCDPFVDWRNLRLLLVAELDKREELVGKESWAKVWTA